MRHKITLLIALLVVAVSSCRKDLKPSWDTDLLLPLGKTSLTIDKIFPDSLVRPNADNSFSLVYKNPVYVFDPASIEEFPDSTLSTSYTALWSLDFNPGQEIVNKKDESKLNIKNIELSYLILKSGKTVFEVVSDIKEVTEIIYGLPHVTKNGQAFFVKIMVPAAKGDNEPGIYKGEFDLSGYAMNLRGSGNKVNTVETSFVVKISETGNKVTVPGGKGIILNNTLSEIKPLYAKGYFGTQKYESGPVDSDFSFLKKVESGTIAFEDMNVELTFTNGIGVDATAKLNKLSSTNTKINRTIELKHQSVGKPLNLNRAVDNLYGSPAVKPSEYKISFNTANSNFKELVENLPDKISGDFDIHFNPLMNISGGNDFLHADYGFSVMLDFEMPLSFSSERLTLVDTVSIDLSENGQKDRIRKGNLTILANNSFPFDAAISIQMLDEDGKIIGVISANDMNLIRAGEVNVTTGVVHKESHSRLVFELDEIKTEQLFNAKNLVLKTAFTTQPKGIIQKIYSHYKLDLKLSAKIQYLIKTD